MNSRVVNRIIASVVVAAFVGLLIFLGVQVSKVCANNACASSQSATGASSESESKPLTEVKCDYTGMMGAQMIEDMAVEGYRYTGRTNTFFCENALAFELKENN